MNHLRSHIDHGKTLRTFVERKVSEAKLSQDVTAELTLGANISRASAKSEKGLFKEYELGLLTHDRRPKRT